MTSDASSGFVSRGGVKLAHALDAFGVDPSGFVCADLGSNVGGFVDCLLQRGADRVYSVDTSYGTLDWGLRKDDRVVVMERTNAMHVVLPEPVNLITVDVGWTAQHLVIPSASELLSADGCIISLIKPHYEARNEKDARHDKRGGSSGLRRGVLAADRVPVLVEAVLSRLMDLGVRCDAMTESPIAGGGGNKELLALLRPVDLQ